MGQISYRKLRHQMESAVIICYVARRVSHSQLLEN